MADLNQGSDETSRKDDLEAVKKNDAIEEVLHQGKLKRWSDWISFFSMKIGGAGLTGVGSLEILSPDSIPAVISEPAAVAGMGFALLVGDKAREYFAQFITKSR